MARDLHGLLRGGSIASRLFLAAAFWCASILVVAGIGLSALNANSTEDNFDDTLELYSKALVANVAVSAEEGHTAPAPVVAPQFELAFSGWYWQITRLDRAGADIRTSKSLFGSQLPALPAADAGADNFFRGYVTGPGGKPLRVIERIIDAGEEGRYLIQVAAVADVMRAQVVQFEYALSATLFALAAALIGSTGLAVRFGLRPLRRLRDGLIAIRRGEAERIAGEYPQDLAPLAAELNLLLDANREVVRRARTQVGNLAHALKTPLSVIVNEAEAGSPKLGEKVREQAEVMRRQVTFYLDRARAAARATSIGASTEFAPVLDGLLRTFQKVYRERGLTFESATAPALRFRGEPQDLADLVGNLLDNAGKWARAKVVVAAERAPAGGASGRDYFLVHIDDDGPGLDPRARATAVERGRRLDESRPGSGLGLSIVVDLAANYGGALELGESPLGGLRATLRLPGF
ncbi:MAG TPA: sensor histidine kinase [Roseiarcus sp.]|nr:sensor histidine kinase [Roseiarcus sp.]